MSEIKLKTCPCCGEELEVIDDGQYYAHKINGCILQHLCFRADDEEGIRLWNTRKPMERIVERVEAARQKYQRLCKEQGEKEDEAMNIIYRGVIRIVEEVGGV